MRTGGSHDFSCYPEIITKVVCMEEPLLQAEQITREMSMKKKSTTRQEKT